MDVEKETRRLLIERLGRSFNCIEEAPLITAKGPVRCDVLARPVDEAFSMFLFAFECKQPNKDWHYAKWARAIKQGIDYVDALPEGRATSLGLVGTRVTCSFLFPAPFEVPSESQLAESDFVREGYENAIAGMFHLALMFRCGRAGTMNFTNINCFGLAIGPNPIWSDRFGFSRVRTH